MTQFCTTEIDQRNVIFVPGTSDVHSVASVKITDCAHVSSDVPRYSHRIPEFW